MTTNTGPAAITRRMASGHCLELLPTAPYSGRDPVGFATIGICLQRQRGVHSIGTDRRSDFDRLPGTVSFAPAGVDVFSESLEGGEFLAIRLHGPMTEFGNARTAGILSRGHAGLLECAFRLRAAMLAPETGEHDLECLVDDLFAVVFPFPGICDRGPVRWIAEAIDQIAQAIADECPVDLSATALHLGLSAPALTRGFRQSIGMTPSRFVRELRLQAARARLVEDPFRPLADVALASGFAHQSHLGKLMCAQYGMTPGQYRRNHASAAGALRR